MERAETIVNAIAEIESKFKPHVIICEEPTSMGMVGRTTNSLGKLLYQVGYLKARIGEGAGWRWYTTNTWKGSLPQSIVVKRVNMLLDLNLKERSSGSYDVDIAHAIGLGVYEIASILPEWEHARLFGDPTKGK